MGSMTFEEIREQRRLLSIQEGLLLRESMGSTDAEAILKAEARLSEMERERGGRTKAFLFAPQNEFLGLNGYRTPLKSVGFRTLRRMARTPVIRTVVGTRCDQVAAHAEPTDNIQEKGWMIQKRVDISGGSDKGIIKKITKSVMDGGFTDHIWEFDSFEAIIREMARDSMELDQICIEIVEDRRGRPVEFKPVDASTIRLVDPVTTPERLPEKFGYVAKYVQEWEGQLYNYFFPWEMSFGVRNKSTDIWTNGYGISELEDLVQIVTGLLNAVTHNSLYFTQGSNPKGFFAIKGDLGHNTVADFQQEWRNTISGVQNSWRVPVIESPNGDIQWIDFQKCLDGDTYVYEKTKGIIRLRDLITKQRVENLEIWTGEKFSKARGYQTGLKRVNKVQLKDGTNIFSSPDHQFKVLENGELVWKERKDLKLDDVLILNKKSIDNHDRKRYSYKGHQLDEDIWEVLGWMSGDGTWRKNKSSCIFQLYYHYEREEDICKRHYEILKKYNLTPILREGEKSDELIEKRKKTEGFKTIIKGTRYIAFHSNDFYWFLKSLGFEDSTECKNIPSSLLEQDLSIIYSFLKGLFSADGSCSNTGGVILCCNNEKLRQQTRFLLSLLGMKSSARVHLNNAFGKIRERRTISVIDAKNFVEKIGFLQQHKIENYKYCNNHRELASFGFRQINKILENIRESRDLLKMTDDEQHYFNLMYRNVTRQGKNTWMGTLRKCAGYTNYKFPAIFDEYDFENIHKLEELDEERYMFDLEIVNDENHQFAANQIITHNSNLDMEFSRFLEFLITMTCCVFKIDPMECGWNFGKMANSIPFGQDGQKQRLKHSQSKGLVPLLKLIQRVITKYWVRRIDDDYEFVFTGIEQDDKVTSLDMDIKKAAAGFASLEDMFEKWSGRPFNPEKDTILNPIWQQVQQQKAMEEQQSAMMGGGEIQTEQNPFEQSMKSYIENVVLA